jgi:hypothetical protein
MRNRSVVGPILLMALGVLLLLYNLRPEWPVLGWITLHWPWLLVAWGVLRLAEILVWAARSRPLPRAGLSGGEWAIVILLCLAGLAADAVRHHWPALRIRVEGVEWLGKPYDFPLEAAQPAGTCRRLVVENPRGGVRVVGAPGSEVKVEGRMTVRALDRAAAEQLRSRMPLQVLAQGDDVVVRVSPPPAEPMAWASSDLAITVPAGFAVAVQGRDGDIDVANLAGDVTIESREAAVRLAEIGGAARIEVRHSRLARAVNVRGGVSLRGRGEDVEMENVTGPVVVQGSYSGDLQFRNLESGLEFESRRTEFRVGRLPGRVRMVLGRLSGSGLVGPVRLKSQTRDVELAELTGEAEIEIERGNVTVRPEGTPLGPLKVSVEAGDIDLAVPHTADFTLLAAAEHGEVINELGPEFRLERRGRGAAIEGGRGPVSIRLRTERGSITLRRLPAEVPPVRAAKPQSGPARLTVEKF